MIRVGLRVPGADVSQLLVGERLPAADQVEAAVGAGADRVAQPAEEVVVVLAAVHERGVLVVPRVVG
jgi:hypothetical protein